jgi:hypothetical protein
MNAPVRQGDWMQTADGGQFWPVDPRADEISIEVISHALAMQCRYAGHCIRFYSVAEHCVHMARSRFVSYPNKPWALLHDASEAYLTDVIRPLKPHLTGYYEAEKRVMDVVIEKFGLASTMPSEVKNADNRILVDERAQNMVQTNHGWVSDGLEPLGVELRFWAPEQAELYFLDTYKKLVRGEQV